MTNGFLIYEEMWKYFPIYEEEAVSHLWLCNCSILNFLIYEENLIVFFISVESGNCNVHSANESVTNLAGQRTAVLSMTVSQTRSVNLQTVMIKLKQTQTLQSFNPPYGPAQGLKRVKFENRSCEWYPSIAEDVFLWTNTVADAQVFCRTEHFTHSLFLSFICYRFYCMELILWILNLLRRYKAQPPSQCLKSKGLL
jgi:hypothetical protein